VLDDPDGEHDVRPALDRPEPVYGFDFDAEFFAQFTDDRPAGVLVAFDVPSRKTPRPTYRDVCRTSNEQVFVIAAENPDYAAANSTVSRFDIARSTPARAVAL